jgi:hypothetical protein
MLSLQLGSGRGVRRERWPNCARERGMGRMGRTQAGPEDPPAPGEGVGVGSELAETWAGPDDPPALREGEQVVRSQGCGWVPTTLPHLERGWKRAVRQQGHWQAQMASALGCW